MGPVSMFPNCSIRRACWVFHDRISVTPWSEHILVNNLFLKSYLLSTKMCSNQKATDIWSTWFFVGMKHLASSTHWTVWIIEMKFMMDSTSLIVWYNLHSRLEKNLPWIKNQKIPEYKRDNVIYPFKNMREISIIIIHLIESFLTFIGSSLSSVRNRMNAYCWVRWLTTEFTSIIRKLLNISSIQKITFIRYR